QRGHEFLDTELARITREAKIGGRAYDLQQKPVVGLAILTDEESNWRPSEYGHALWGTRLHQRGFSHQHIIDLFRFIDIER
ncbi:MAG: hypothetical protein HQL62_08015, partial [Magnetococcales bacterium]|nr:hypothetical protein [Magnetococcales bacterium]